MEIPSKILEQRACKTRHKTKNKHIETANTFLTEYNGIIIFTNKNNKFYFANSISDRDSFVQITIAQGADDLQSLKDEIRRIIIDEG